MKNSKAMNTVAAMTMLETVDLAPALKFTAVREKEPAITSVRQTRCANTFRSIPEDHRH